jgi:hypothetical protein
LGTHDSGPRAGDIGYPEWPETTLSEKFFIHPALLMKGLSLLAGQLCQPTYICAIANLIFLTKPGEN